MSKTTMSIKLLKIYNTGRKYKRSELAEYLETNARNIVEYNKELISAGYDIKSVSGVNGGYYLDRSNLLPVLKLTDNERDVLRRTINYLNARSDYLDKKEYDVIMGKIFSNIETYFGFEDILVFDRYPLNIKEEDLKYRYNIIEDAIKCSKKVKISYFSSKERDAEYVICPYIVYIYNNCWYTLAYVEEFEKVSYFKLNRIKSLHILSQCFLRPRDFSRETYFDKFGMVGKDTKTYKVKLKLVDVKKVVLDERIHGYNQVVTQVGENELLFEADMLHKSQIVQFVLGFGNKATVLEPNWLKEKVIFEVQGMVKNYE